MSRVTLALGLALLAAATASVWIVAAGDQGNRTWVIVLVTFALVPVAFLIGVLRGRLTRQSVTDVVVALQAGIPIRDALAEALNDPSLEIAYRLPGGVQWVDPEGRRVSEPQPTDERAVTLVEWVGLPIAALVHDATLTQDRELVDAVAAAASLSLQNERLQTQVRAQVQFVTTITDTAPSLLVSMDTDGRILNQNRAAVAAAGLDDQELVRGRFFWDVFISPEERDDVIERFRALAPDFVAGEYENVFVNERGEERTIAWRAAPVLGPDGAVESIVAGGMDITERQRLADEKERERAFLNAIANNAPSLLCLIDETGTVAHHATNKAFERSLDYEPDRTGGHLFWERYIDPAEADDVRRLIERVVAGEEVGEHDHQWLTRTGDRLLIAWTCTPLPHVDERTMFLISGVDVTERKRREVELQRERDATTTVIQTIPSFIVVLDVDGAIVDRVDDHHLAAVNRAFHETLGWSDEQLIGRQLIELLDEADRDVARSAIVTAAGGGLSGELESHWARADSSQVVVAWRAASVADATGRRPSLVLVTGMDITERKARERESERQRDFLYAITEAIPSFIAVVDTEALVVEHGVNRAFTETFGWTVTEIAGRSFLDVLSAEDQHAGRMAIANAANGVVQPELESCWLRQDGETRVVAWTAWPVVDETGRNLVLVSGADATERRRREAEIQAGEARLRAVIEGAPVAIVELGRDERVKLWNPAAERIFGWSPEEVLGQPTPIVPPERDHEFRALLTGILAGHAYTGHETVRTRRDGSLVDVEISAAPIRDAGGAVIGHIAVLTDISQRKLHEDEMRASRSRIVAAADDARRKLERNLHDGAQQRLVAVSVSLRLAEARLIDDPALAASILAAARSELAQALEELRELARGIHPAVLTDRGLAAAVDGLVSRAPVPVTADIQADSLEPAVEAAIYYVISEALANVAKHAEARSVDVRVVATGDVITATVADDGVGGADPLSGSGLRGLADRVAALDGTLSIESPPGDGTRVRADIPVRSHAQTP